MNFDAFDYFLLGFPFFCVLDLIVSCVWCNNNDGYM